MMWFQWWIVPETHDKTTACISKCVMNLLLRQLAIRQWIDVQIGSLRNILVYNVFLITRRKIVNIIF